MIIITVTSFLLATMHFLLIRSGVGINPWPTSQSYESFACSKINITLAHLNIQNILSRNETKLDRTFSLLKQSVQSPLVMEL